MALPAVEYCTPSAATLVQQQSPHTQAVAFRAVVGVQPRLPDPKQRSAARATGTDGSAISESTIALEALRLIAQTHNGFMTTSDLILALDLRFEPTGEDAEIIAGRWGTRFILRVRDLVSYRTGGNDLEIGGFVVYDPIRQGFIITLQGREAAHEKRVAAPRKRDEALDGQRVR